MEKNSPLITKRTIGTFRGSEFKLAYHGEEHLLRYVEPYLADAIFGCQPHVAEVAAGCRASWISDADLLVRVRHASPDDGDAVLIPLWVKFVVDLRSPDGPAPPKREQERQARRVARYGYSYELSYDEADFEFFYDRMHAPTMRARHQDKARMPGRQDALEELFRNGFLFFVLANGGRVAGVLCQVEADIVNARLAGWMDGDPLHLKREAFRTATHFLIGWCRSAGFRLIDFQGCESFLTKGTYQSKRRLGTTTVLPPGVFGEMRVQLLAARDSAAVRDILVSQPPIVIDQSGRLGAAYFYDAVRPARTDIPFRCDGMEFARLVNLDEYLAGDGHLRWDLEAPCDAS